MRNSLLNISITLLLLFVSGITFAQEFKCNVSVSAPQLQSDRQIYEQMQKAIWEYINNRSWSDHEFLTHEKIKVNMTFIINDRPSITDFKGTLQVRVTRPVMNSTYETISFNFQDKNIAFKYVTNQTMEFSENSFINNLTSILNFYAYFILGVDYDTMSPNGGAPFFSKAQNIVNLAGNSGFPGWSARDNGMDTRYKIMEDMIHSTFRKYHDAVYMYYRQGLDMMHKDMPKARANVLAALKLMQKVNVQNPGSQTMRTFLNANRAEIVNIFKTGFPPEKTQLIGLMTNLDPSHVSDYEEVNKNKD